MRSIYWEIGNVRGNVCASPYGLMAGRSKVRHQNAPNLHVRFYFVNACIIAAAPPLAHVRFSHLFSRCRQKRTSPPRGMEVGGVSGGGGGGDRMRQRMGQGKEGRRTSGASGGIGQSGGGGGGFGSLVAASGSCYFGGIGGAPLAAAGCHGAGVIDEVHGAELTIAFIEGFSPSVSISHSLTPNPRHQPTNS